MGWSPISVWAGTMVMNWARLKESRYKHPVAFRVAISVLVGSLLQLAAFTIPFPALKFTRRASDDMADVLMARAVQSRSMSESAPRFSFIDIDDTTWMAWNAPLITPRQKIATLLSRVAESKPALMILDVDLSYSDDPQSETALAAFFKGYPDDDAPVILTRNFQPTSDAIPYRPRHTAYESVTKGNVYWALPSFERDDDGTVRRWQLATVACDAGTPVSVASVQLQAAWLWRGLTPNSLREKLGKLRPENCGVTVQDMPLSIPLDEAGHRIAFNSGDPSARIIYTMPWVPGAVVQGPKMRDGNNKVIVRSADTVTRIDPGTGIPGVEGTIAVIGGSFRDSGDWHKTPLGQMPGAMILINSIDALAQFGTLGEPPRWQQFSLGLVFIVLVAICVGVFRARVAASLSLVAVYILSVVTVPLFRSGIVFSLAIPALGIVLADLILSVWDETDVIRQTGWRWIFRPTKPQKPAKETK